MDKTEIAQRLKDHVVLLSEQIGERNFLYPGNLEKAAVYITKSFRETGYNTQFMDYEVRRRPCRNIEVTIPGEKPGGPIVLVGAHYDTAPGTPGADDNASAIAVLLELGREFAGEKLKKEFRLVAFSTEEPPYFRSRHMGSAVYARAAKKKKENIEAMICLEMLGYFTDREKSQFYPPLLNFFYPSKGNFIALVSNLPSRPLMKKMAKLFKSHCTLPLEVGSFPRFVPGIDLSDHLNFWKAGYPAVMLTDTAFYRYTHYHEPTDTYEKLDYRRMAELFIGLVGTIRDMTT
jgi:Zn-dependent M28 family amino/carboxypeptidase